jgi:hypothetical protein
MKELTLLRESSADTGTFGKLHGLKTARQLHTLELPWRGNINDFSCIPCGRYLCKIVQSPRFGRVYGVTGVPGRADILFHSGNHAGDKKKGLKSEVKGCILLGLARGILAGQAAVTESRPAIVLFMKALNGDDFYLTIRNQGA